VHSETNIFIELSEPQNIGLQLFNQNGQLVRTFLQGEQAAGRHQFLLQTANLQTGMYYLQMLGKDKIEVKRMIVQK